MIYHPDYIEVIVAGLAIHTEKIRLRSIFTPYLCAVDRLDQGLDPADNQPDLLTTAGNHKDHSAQLIFHIDSRKVLPKSIR